MGIGKFKDVVHYMLPDN